MKVKLVVASGVHEGREIPLAGPQFLIGRDPQCQLRPSSPAISKRHCAIIIRGGKVFVRDFGSTNGTFIDGNSIQGEIEVNNQARLKAGPLDFKIMIEVAKAAPTPPKTPIPKAKPKGDDDEFAAFLLEGDEGAANAPPGIIPDGSTVMEIAAQSGQEGEKKDAAKPDAKKNADADTRSAAADILRQYQRRPRS